MSDFQFDFNPSPTPSHNPAPSSRQPNPNMEDLMDKVDKFSIDWDNFQQPHNNSSNVGSHSAVSDIFNKSKKSQSQKSQRIDFDDSRDIMEISIIGMGNNNNNGNNHSFRFQRDDYRETPVMNNQRYTKLQKLLENAKKNSLDQFYKNIDRETKAYSDQPQKFNNYRQFKQYVRDLKSEMRNKQINMAEKQSMNPFATGNSNRMFGTNGTNLTNGSGTGIQRNRIVNNNQVSAVREEVRDKPQYNFMKKATIDKNTNIDQNDNKKLKQMTSTSTVQNNNKNNLLPNEFQAQDFFKQQQPQNFTKQNPAQHYHNFYQGQKLPQKAAEHNKQQDAFEFLQMQSNPQSNIGLNAKESKQTLQPIRQQKHNSFEKTFQQQKLDNIFKNYQVMRKNFQELMTQLKSTSQGQEKLVTQIRKLKDQKLQNQVKQERKQRKQKKQRQIQEKNKKLDIIKDQITKIKTSDKDILYSQINKKIQQLESVVRSALQQINQQKQAKIIPKVTNYFFQQQPKHFNNPDQESFKGFQEFDPQAYKNNEQVDLQESHRSNNSQSRQMLAQKVQNLNVNSRKNLSVQKSPAQSATKFQYQKSQHSKSHHSKQRSPHQLSRQVSGTGSRVRQTNYNNFFSPLDLHLQGSGNSLTQLNYSMHQNQQDFTPEQFAQQHFPKQFQGYIKNLRNSLLQKSSVVYQSFDFHVSAKFSIVNVNDQLHPLIAAMRVGNKCSIDLYDVHVITYGPQGPGISTDPSTIFQQQLKKNTSFAFQVSLDKSCLQDNGFSIQISYKTDSMSKKKINFKIPLPMIQLIRPEFIYEQKFQTDWQSLKNQLFLKPTLLDSTYLRSHEDVKLILPFIQLSQQNPDCFSYGLAFRYPKSDNLFYLKFTCFVSGKASIQLRAQKNNNNGDRKLKEEILNVLNFIFYSS